MEHNNARHLIKLAGAGLVILVVGGWLLTDRPEGDPDQLAQVSQMQQGLLAMSQQLSQASQDLVVADAAARKEMAELQNRLQQELEVERRHIDQGRDELERERRELARQRHREPLIAAALIQSVTLILACLPLVLTVLLLRQTASQPADREVCELLVLEYLPALGQDEVTVLEPRRTGHAEPGIPVPSEGDPLRR